tara:strand:+ start:349 stop:564 length:216 start_codon:yes stop_codon:yes gene_type:complete
MSEWISVEDELPPHYENVLIYPYPEFSDEYRFVGEYDLVRKKFIVWVGSDGVHSEAHVTHWMPLPKPPPTQ